ncbi:hypothetical protein GPECTOR_38g280 [Gonium pectorale]|uniref:Structural maintenance of chromosomes protein 5 n=1 Tax=Gonium pectorale TaxID=33097 RepID=A0A150GB90_GONPE|nr:hypothetical protein GPECTOR_38g280 [Gonium pectorale]|eukprot:KXZ47043.1 hypothetical protein GPECTOR_38g280 [Gonium pectorale]
MADPIVTSYPRGAIKRIRMKDFMSFCGTLLVEAGPRVNLFAGPNGSGKSSVVTAICMGLAGNMKSLNRQTKPSELIRRGSRAFEIEITLCGGPGNPDIVVFRRTERADGAGGAAGARPSKRRRANTAGGSGAAGAGGGGDDDDGDGEDDAGDGGERVHTVWRVDGREVPQKRVVELARSLGIHFDNLCQFLPQERVQEFTNLNPAQLLECTEEAIGDGTLLRQHNELKQRSGQLTRKREDLEQLKKHLARLEAEHSAAEPEYRRLQRRNALRREVDKIRQKVAWQAREAATRQAARARDQVARTEQDVVAAQQREAAAQAPLNARLQALHAAEQAARRLTQQARAKEQAVEAAAREMRRLEDSNKEKEDALVSLGSRSRDWRDCCDAARAQVAKAREELSELPEGPPPELDVRVAQLQQLEQAKEGEAAEAHYLAGMKRGELHQIDQQIRSLEAVAARRNDRRERLLNKLDERYPGSRALYSWLDEERTAGRFNGRVYGPVLLEMSAVVDPDWAAYLEKILGSNVAAIVTENIEDNNRVQDWLSSQRARPGGRWKKFLNKVLFVRNPDASIQYPAGRPTADMAQRYGITHTLDQLFEAEHLVKLALSNASGINATYVGSRLTDSTAVINRVISETPIRRVMTPAYDGRLGKFTNIRTSAFSGQSYQGIDECGRATLLAEGEGEAEDGDEQQRLAELQQARNAAMGELRSLEETKRTLDGELAQIRDEKRRIVAQKSGYSTRRASIVRKETDALTKLRRLEGQGDPAAAAPRLRNELAAGLDAVAAQALHMLALLRDLHAHNHKLAVPELAVASAQAGLQALRRAVKAATDDLRAAEGALAAARNNLAHEEERAAEAAERARELLGGRDRPAAELRREWAQWPDEPEELEQLLAEKQDEAQRAQEAMRGDEAAVLDAWQRREEELKRLRKDTETATAALEAAVADVEARKAAWLPELQRHMAAVNDSVKGHFKAIGCAGEVVLREAGDAFQDYATEIRVSYRPQEPVQPLDRNRHSGGERTVATMLYLMALQGVTTTPFRVVDEINQGMDARNERKVFNLLVECSSRPDTPQCFLLTPKVIADLRYSRHVLVQNMLVLNAGALGGDTANSLLLAAGQADGSQQEDDGHAARPAGQQRRQQPQPMGLGELPWQEIKRLVFFGRRGARSRAQG